MARCEKFQNIIIYLFIDQFNKIYLSIETGNLIDLNSDGAASLNSSGQSEHNYVNDTVIAANKDSRREPASLFDAFDMRTNL